MTDAVKEEFIKLVGPRPFPERTIVFGENNVRACDAWDQKLEGFRLARSNGVPAGEADRLRIEKLTELCGFVEDGSSEYITISLDDATNHYTLSVGRPKPHQRWWWGSSLREAIDNAIAQPKEAGE